MEGAYHARYVPEGGALDASFGEVSGGFAFKVSDDKVIARVEHLPQVVVTVAADAHTRDTLPGDSLETLDDCAFLIENRLRNRPHIVR